MDQAYDIWAPVIVSRLPAPRKLDEQKAFAVDKTYQSFEDLRVKVRESEAYLSGQAVEIKIKLNILCLVEDMNGKTHLLNRQETVKDRVPLTEFENTVNSEKDLNYIIEIINISVEGEITSQQIAVAYFIDYLLMAAREQLVQLSTGTSIEEQPDSLREAFLSLKNQLTHVQEENHDLRKKLFLYIRDVSSLKKGVHKVENRNAILNREVKYYRQLVGDLRQQLDVKERRVYQHQNLNTTYSNNHTSHETETLNGLGSRIKRMFLNNT
ncbi:MAG: hypothetical protein PHT79_08910 [Syntrophomonadaceae bacterium]|nr:hypothetical protein [Syntrophomonadaceae bacterium]MDD3889299.1 hypothetical protein [Syntrophomonadaceae bacterium]MDD4549860.1 hypothetical protein [Syntrophomonadaceae bacterium]